MHDRMRGKIMNDFNYDDAADRMARLLESAKYATLANADKNGIVRTSQMCLANDGLVVHMQTDSKFDKIKNIRENPNVSINIGAYNFSGLARIAGHPSEKQ
jgi:general stress protein 26